MFNSPNQVSVPRLPALSAAGSLGTGAPFYSVDGAPSMRMVCWGITCPHFLNLARRFSFHLQVNVSENSSWGNICLTHSCPGQLKFPNKPNLSKRESYEKKSSLRFSGQHFFSIKFKEHLFISFALVPNAPLAAAVRALADLIFDFCFHV